MSAFTWIASFFVLSACAACAGAALFQCAKGPLHPKYGSAPAQLRKNRRR